MTQPRPVECTFYIPRRRDSNLSDGKLHAPSAWRWLDERIETDFPGGTVAPGWHRGFYRDRDTGLRVTDQSRQFTVALPRPQVERLRQLLAHACVVFKQKMIYLSVAGRVEFVEAIRNAPDDQLS